MTPLRSSKNNKLGIITPLANEEQTIEEFLERVLKQIAPQDKIFCILDNASKDKTKEKIEAAIKKDLRINLVWAPENKSVVDAYFKGYQEALKDDCDWILEMDGGLSHLPEEIPRFLEAMQDGYEFAAGSRFIKGGKHSKIGIRHLISKVGTLASNLLLGTKMKDMTSGFECFNRETLKELVANGLKSKGHFMQTEIRFLLKNHHWKEIPITYSNPSNSLSIKIIKDSLKNLWELSRTQKKHPKTRD